MTMRRALPLIMLAMLALLLAPGEAGACVAGCPTPQRAIELMSGEIARDALEDVALLNLAAVLGVLLWARTSARHFWIATGAIALLASLVGGAMFVILGSFSDVGGPFGPAYESFKSTKDMLDSTTFALRLATGLQAIALFISAIRRSAVKPTYV